MHAQRRRRREKSEGTDWGCDGKIKENTEKICRATRPRSRIYHVFRVTENHRSLLFSFDDEEFERVTVILFVAKEKYDSNLHVDAGKGINRKGTIGRTLMTDKFYSHASLTEEYGDKAAALIFLLFQLKVSLDDSKLQGSIKHELSKTLNNDQRAGVTRCEDLFSDFATEYIQRRFRRFCSKESLIFEEVTAYIMYAYWTRKGIMEREEEGVSGSGEVVWRGGVPPVVELGPAIGSRCAPARHLCVLPTARVV
ncbi:hypothetical protein J6590_004277 [Homalodisca vitripennis]|nr:hypothetical protein J6590_004277 [Homalodisca vitripennis]